jgi:phosphohistidine phosphatase
MMSGAMKQLFVLRHAKSSWDHPELDDHDRPLNKRGKRDAPRMGRLLAEENLLPDRIVSSTATRARATAEKVAEACGYGRPIVLTRELYLATPGGCLALLAQIPDEDDSAMLVGHNPGMEELIELLTGRAERMPTAALARIALPIDTWGSLTRDMGGDLLALWRPKQLPDAG